jgi:hypothetical protein
MRIARHGNRLASAASHPVVLVEVVRGRMVRLRMCRPDRAQAERHQASPDQGLGAEHLPENCVCHEVRPPPAAGGLGDFPVYGRCFFLPRHTKAGLTPVLARVGRKMTSALLVAGLGLRARAVAQRLRAGDTGAQARNGQCGKDYLFHRNSPSLAGQEIRLRRRLRWTYASQMIIGRTCIEFMPIPVKRPMVVGRQIAVAAAAYAFWAPQNTGADPFTNPVTFDRHAACGRY